MRNSNKWKQGWWWMSHTIKVLNAIMEVHVKTASILWKSTGLSWFLVVTKPSSYLSWKIYKEQKLQFRKYYFIIEPLWPDFEIKHINCWHATNNMYCWALHFSIFLHNLVEFPLSIFSASRSSALSVICLSFMSFCRTTVFLLSEFQRLCLIRFPVLINVHKFIF